MSITKDEIRGLKNLLTQNQFVLQLFYFPRITNLFYNEQRQNVLILIKQLTKININGITIIF